MGRTYYAIPKAPVDDTHTIHVPHGTVVLTVRPPVEGERGYWVGIDFTIRQAVREMLADWDPSDDGPGWVEGIAFAKQLRQEKKARDSHSDDTFAVTILAAFLVDARRSDTEDANDDEEHFDPTRPQVGDDHEVQ